jgi:hypothetical protein
VTAALDEFQRELIVENTLAGLAAANKRGRRGGRPKGMDEEGLRKAEAMLKDTENYPFVGDVIDKLKIGRTAFYRYFPPDRIRELRRTHSEEGDSDPLLWWVMYLCLEKPNDLKTNAPQLNDLECWCRILSEAMKEYLNGQILRPPNPTALA